MSGLSTILGGDFADFCVSSIVFLLLYVTGFVSLQRWSSTSKRTPAIHRHLMSGLGATLVAMGVGFALHSAGVTMASVKGQSVATASISPLELHRSIGKSLPVQNVEDQAFVFTNRD